MSNKKSLLEYYGTQRPTFAGNGGAGSNFSIGRNLGVSGADAKFSSYMSNKKVPVDYFEVSEEDVEEDMEEEILEKRISSNGKFELESTLANIVEDYEYLDKTANALKYGARFTAKGFKAGSKAALLGIPIIDSIAGSIYLSSGVLKFRNISNQVIEFIDTEENTFAEALGSPSEYDWQAILERIEMLSIEDRKELAVTFEDLLENIKSFIVTLVQAYDSVVLAAPAALAAAPTGGLGAVAVEGGGNLIVSLGGFLTEMVPIEQLVFDLYTKYAAAIEQLFNYVSNSDKMDDMEQKGGPIFSSILLHPAQSLRRMGEFYEAISSEKAPMQRLASKTFDRLASGDIPNLSSEPMSSGDFMQQVTEAYRKTDDEAFSSQSLSIFLLEDSENESVRPMMRGQHDQAGYASGLYEEPEEDDVDEIDEMSAGGVAGVGMKIGHNPDGTPTTKKQLKQLRSKQDIYQIAERQKWSHVTLGKIKF